MIGLRIRSISTMFSLFTEARLWTYKNTVQIRDNDFGAFKLHEKKEIQKCDLDAVGKELYSEARGVPTVLRNRRPERLRSRVRELEHVLENQAIAWVAPQPDGFIKLITVTGLVINLKTHLLTGSLQAVKFDRYLVGHFSEICDVAATKSHFVFTHAENQLTLVHLMKPLSSASPFEKLQKLEPKILTIELVGGSGRRLHRRVSANASGEFILTWWQTSSHEVYPWAPSVKDWDRANVHIYSLFNTNVELVTYFRTESEPICIQFSHSRNNVLWAVEQKISRKGDVTVESSCYQLSKKQLIKKCVTSIPLQTHVSCHSFSPDENRLALGCIDGSVVLLEEGRSVTRQVRAAFIPTLLRWHPAGALLLCANDRGQLQFFDLALSCVRAQLMSEDLTPSNLIDLGAYFTSQPILLEMCWGFRESVPFFGEKYVPSDNFLMLFFEGGPIASLHLVGGGGLVGDVHSLGLTPDTLTRMYISWHQIDKAIGILLSLDWNKEGAQCLASLYHIANALFRAPLTRERELQLETALGCFHAPLRALNSPVYEEFSDQVHDLTRRFFHQLVRHKLYEKAFSLSVDLNDRDLYLDLQECARRLGDGEMASAVRDQLQAMGEDSEESSCSCDESSCDEHGLPPLPTVKKPSLPDLSRFGKLRESAFFTRAQPSFSMIPEENELPALSTDKLVDGSLPGVIEKLYDLPSKPRLMEHPAPHTATFMRNWMSQPTKTLSSTLPYVPSSTVHFSSILGPSSAISSSQPSTSILPQNPSGASLSSGSSQPSPFYPANPLSSHLYGVANKVSEQKSSSPAAPVKPKVKFSDTVTQIVVPDISQLSGEKPRRVAGIDPAKELADSLPLCLGNKDYLKNFSKPDEDEEMHGATIKVIHFGVV